jgi:hypothetical protein
MSQSTQDENVRLLLPRQIGRYLLRIDIMIVVDALIRYGHLAGINQFKHLTRSEQPSSNIYDLFSALEHLTHAGLGDDVSGPAL